MLLLDAATGEVVTRFDLAENDAVPSVYPVAVLASKDRRRGFVALWNASEVVELDLMKGTVGRKLPLLKPQGAVAAGSHPDALTLSPDGDTLYVALGNRDAVAAIGLGGGRFGLEGFFDVRLPGQSFFGAEPEALAMNADGSRLYVANMASDAVAVLDPHKLTRKSSSKGFVEPMGFIPTEWLADGPGVYRRQALHCERQSNGYGAKQFRAASDRGDEERVAHEAGLYLHSNAAAWVAGGCGCKDGGRPVEGADAGDARGQPDEGGGGEDCLGIPR